MADLYRVRCQGEQPFGGEGLQDCFHIPDLGWVFAFGQFRPGGPVRRVNSVADSGGQPCEHLPGRSLLAWREMVVGALRAVCYCPFDTASSLIVGEG